MNNTTKTIQQEQICALSSEQRYIKILTLSVVTLATYFGNSLILMTLRKFSNSFKGNLYVIIANLAVADLLLAVGLTLQLVEYVLLDLKSSKYFCLLKTCCLVVSLACSSDLLSYMSFDRFCAIMCPMKHLVNSSRRRGRRFLILLTWIFSILIGCIPIFISVKLTSREPHQDFMCKYGYILSYKVSYIVAILLPLQFFYNIFMCLVVVLRVLTNHVARNKVKRSIIKCVMTLQVYILFALCWAPYVVATFLMVTSQGNESKYFCFREYAILLGFMNSGMNWILYGLTNKKFRKSFKGLLTCKHPNKEHIPTALIGQNERLADIGESENQT